MAEHWTAEQVLDLARTFQGACVITAAAELDVFSVLRPRMRAAASVASKLRANMEFGAVAPYAAGYKDLHHTLQGTYECLGVTPTDVGGYVEAVGADGVVEYHDGLEPAAPTTSPAADYVNPIEKGQSSKAHALSLGLVAGAACLLL